MRYFLYVDGLEMASLRFVTACCHATYFDNVVLKRGYCYTEQTYMTKNFNQIISSFNTVVDIKSTPIVWNGNSRRMSKQYTL